MATEAPRPIALSGCRASPRDLKSVKTDSKSVAIQKAEGMWAGYLKAWEGKLAGRDGDAEALFRAARDLAQTGESES